MYQQWKKAYFWPESASWPLWRTAKTFTCILCPSRQSTRSKQRWKPFRKNTSPHTAKKQAKPNIKKGSIAKLRCSLFSFNQCCNSYRIEQTTPLAKPSHTQNQHNRDGRKNRRKINMKHALEAARAVYLRGLMQFGTHGSQRSNIDNGIPSKLLPNT